MSPSGIKLPIWNIRTSGAIRGKADIILLSMKYSTMTPWAGRSPISAFTASLKG
jgi:hypothetical protein